MSARIRPATPAPHTEPVRRCQSSKRRSDGAASSGRPPRTAASTRSGAESSAGIGEANPSRGAATASRCDSASSGRPSTTSSRPSAHSAADAGRPRPRATDASSDASACRRARSPWPCIASIRARTASACAAIVSWRFSVASATASAAALSAAASRPSHDSNAPSCCSAKESSASPPDARSLADGGPRGGEAGGHVAEPDGDDAGQQLMPRPGQRARQGQGVAQLGGAALPLVAQQLAHAAQQRDHEGLLVAVAGGDLRREAAEVGEALHAPGHPARLGRAGQHVQREHRILRRRLARAREQHVVGLRGRARVELGGAAQHRRRCAALRVAGQRLGLGEQEPDALRASREPLRLRGGDEAPRARRAVGRELRGALEHRAGSRVAAAARGAGRLALEPVGERLVGGLGGERAVPRAPVAVEQPRPAPGAPRGGGARSSPAWTAARRSASISTRPPATRSRPASSSSSMPRRGSRARTAGSPVSSSAASTRTSGNVSGYIARTRGPTGSGSGSGSEPVSCARVSIAGSSASASGLPAGERDDRLAHVRRRVRRARARARPPRAAAAARARAGRAATPGRRAARRGARRRRRRRADGRRTPAHRRMRVSRRCASSTTTATGASARSSSRSSRDAAMRSCGSSGCAASARSSVPPVGTPRRSCCSPA